MFDKEQLYPFLLQVHFLEHSLPVSLSVSVETRNDMHGGMYFLVRRFNSN